eukprot:TRINITY_DN2786_c0_g1_i1.p1 TRINITY_DN2786_c0_g1~~TRINITY_DN2786_c0_g1_i1.p1  ORF type:complete len:606 (-),score=77.25 TRINITY_DN2786_c0_g1_i1:81-1898(-)
MQQPPHYNTPPPPQHQQQYYAPPQQPQQTAYDWTGIPIDSQQPSSSTYGGGSYYHLNASGPPQQTPQYGLQPPPGPLGGPALIMASSFPPGALGDKPHPYDYASILSHSSTSDAPSDNDRPMTIATVAPYSAQHDGPPLLLVFVNVRSGGNQGKQLLPQFRELLPEDQVVDLIAEKGPTDALKKFNGRPGLRILACGGDGTGKWVLEVLDKLGINPNPPVGVLPLGTGNDIGRVLGWGGGYDRGQSLSGILDDVTNAVPLLLDRWSVKIDSNEKHESHVLNNYLCIGFADAQVALEFHKDREQNPHMYFNRGVNKLWYAHYGVKQSLMSAIIDPGNLADMLDVTIDGQSAGLEADVKGIVVLNLPSYAGGMNLWGTDRDHRYNMVSVNDGLIEVIGVHSPLHLARVSAGLARGVRIGQGKDIVIAFKPLGPGGLPCKIDGEPWLQESACTFHVSFLKQSWMLCRARSAASVTEPQKTGWADKQGYKVRTWRRRWFVLKDQQLYYFATTQDRQPKGCINITVAKASLFQSVIPVTLGGKPNMITIETGSGNRSYYMSFDTAEEARSWVDEINKAALQDPSAAASSGAGAAGSFLTALSSPFRRGKD